MRESLELLRKIEADLFMGCKQLGFALVDAWISLSRTLNSCSLTSPFFGFLCLVTPILMGSYENSARTNRFFFLHKGLIWLCLDLFRGISG